MTETSDGHALLLLVVGAVVVASLPVRRRLGRIGVPGMVGFVAAGLALSAAHALWGFMSPAVEDGIGILAKLGVVVLLFKVGLESDVDLLLRQLGNAAIVWLPNLAIAGALAFATIALWPDYGVLPALFAGVAASATSIGVSTEIWEEAGKLQSPEGALLVDVAELDDLSAVLLMSLLLVVAPVLADEAGRIDWGVIAGTAGVQLAKLTAFCAACYAFSRFAEKALTAWFGTLDPTLGPLLFATGTAILIASAADLLGFSLAIGALFAGLAFSRDPAEREIDRAFAQVFALFSPFFFLAIGLAVNIEAVTGAIWLGLALFAAATLGKIAGAGVPAAFVMSPGAGFRIGISMVPRAEIFLVVMLHGLAFGAVTDELYAAAVFTSIATCILAPVGVRALMPAPPGREEPA